MLGDSLNLSRYSFHPRLRPRTPRWGFTQGWAEKNGRLFFFWFWQLWSPCQKSLAMVKSWCLMAVCTRHQKTDMTRTNQLYISSKEAKRSQNKQGVLFPGEWWEACKAYKMGGESSIKLPLSQDSSLPRCTGKANLKRSTEGKSLALPHPGKGQFSNQPSSKQQNLSSQRPKKHPDEEKFFN